MYNCSMLLLRVICDESHVDDRYKLEGSERNIPKQLRALVLHDHSLVIPAHDACAMLIGRMGVTLSIIDERDISLYTALVAPCASTRYAYAHLNITGPGCPSHERGVRFPFQHSAYSIAMAREFHSEGRCAGLRLYNKFIFPRAGLR